MQRVAVGCKPCHLRSGEGAADSSLTPRCLTLAAAACGTEPVREALAGEGTKNPSRRGSPPPCSAGRDGVAGAASILSGPSSGGGISTSRAAIPQVNPAELGCDPAQVGFMVFSAKAVQVSQASLSAVVACQAASGGAGQQLHGSGLWQHTKAPVGPHKLWQHPAVVRCIFPQSAVFYNQPDAWPGNAMSPAAFL